MLRLNPIDFGELIRKIEEDDPFDLAILAKDMGLTHEDAEFLEEAQDRISAVIAGEDDQFRIVIARALRSAGILAMDRITAELAAHVGCDPATACMLAPLLNLNLSIDDQATDEMIVFVDGNYKPDEEGTITSIWLGEDIAWHANGGIALHIQETILHGAVGRQLKEIISHPVLDRYDLKVVSIDTDSTGRPVFRVESGDGHFRRPLEVDEILAIRPEIHGFGGE